MLYGAITVVEVYGIGNKGIIHGGNTQSGIQSVHM